MKNIPQEEIMSYKMLYRMIGILGMALPFLDVWKCDCVVPPSISESYYLGAIVPFVLILGSLGLIFFCNEGFNNFDKWCNRISGVAAIGVISFPCESDDCVACIPYPCLHYASAIVLFITFFVMCFFVFTKIRSPKSCINGKKTSRKKSRDLIYKVCGISILVGMAIVFKNKFWGEVWMLESFGFAYFVQGKTLFKD